MARLRKKKLAKRKRQQTKFQMRMGLATNMADEEFEAPDEGSLFTFRCVVLFDVVEALVVCFTPFVNFFCSLPLVPSRRHPSWKNCWELEPR